MPYKLVPIAFEKVEITDEEQARINQIKKDSLERRINRDPEAYKLKIKEQNRRAYLKRKQMLAEQRQTDEQKSDM